MITRPVYLEDREVGPRNDKRVGVVLVTHVPFDDANQAPEGPLLIQHQQQERRNPVQPLAIPLFKNVKSGTRAPKRDAKNRDCQTLAIGT